MNHDSADDSMGPDSNPAYGMTITAKLASGDVIRRSTRESPRAEPRPGQCVRFRHNTRDLDDLQDILFLEFVDEAVQRTGEEAS